MSKRVTREKVIKHKKEDSEIEIRETVVFGSPSDDKDFLKIYPLFIEVLQEDLKIKNGRLKLFLWFVSQIRDIKPNAEPLVVAEQEEMAKAIAVNLRTIQRYIEGLLKNKYISRYKGIKSAYLVNPELIYKGSVQKYFNLQYKKKQREEQHKRYEDLCHQVAESEAISKELKYGNAPQADGENKTASKKKRPSN